MSIRSCVVVFLAGCNSVFGINDPILNSDVPDAQVIATADAPLLANVDARESTVDASIFGMVDATLPSSPDAPSPLIDAPFSKPDAGFQQPTGTVAINFSVDDTANHVYGPGDLEWQGGMKFEESTRRVTADPSWAGPFPPLFDDGPWTNGGHEPIGAIAGDHRWGIAVFMEPPSTGTKMIDYGLNDASYQARFGEGWVWNGANGIYSVGAGDVGPILAAGQTFPPFGNVDLRLTIDTTNLGPGTWNTSTVKVKCSVVDWAPFALTVGGDGKATFTLSAVVGPGKTFDHSGLVASGSAPEFDFLLGGSDYASTTGVSAAYKPSGQSSFTPLSVTSAQNRLRVSVP